MFRAALVVQQVEPNKLNSVKFGYGISVVRLLIQRTTEVKGSARVTRDENAYSMYSADNRTWYTFICESQRNPVIDCSIGGTTDSELLYRFRVGDEHGEVLTTHKTTDAELSLTEQDIQIGELSIGFSATDGNKMSVGVRPEKAGTTLSTVFPYAWYDIPRSRKSEHILDNQGHQYVASTDPNGAPADIGFHVVGRVIEVEQNDVRWYVPNTGASGVIKDSTGKKNLIYLPSRSEVKE